MGWANCGTDEQGRPIGYAHDAKCDHPGCSAEIHRGLAYACGGMHGSDEHSCGKYFCPDHLTFVCVDGEWKSLCDECFEALKRNESYEETEDGDFVSSNE